MKKSANEGGCFFCHDDTEPLVFDREYDTFVHINCIMDSLVNYPGESEAEQMRYLLKEVRR